MKNMQKPLTVFALPVIIRYKCISMNCFRANRSKGRGAKLQGLLRETVYASQLPVQFLFSSAKCPPWENRRAFLASPALCTIQVKTANSSTERPRGHGDGSSVTVAKRRSKGKTMEPSPVASMLQHDTRPTKANRPKDRDAKPWIYRPLPDHDCQAAEARV